MPNDTRYLDLQATLRELRHADLVVHSHMTAKCCRVAQCVRAKDALVQQELLKHAFDAALLKALGEVQP